MNEIMKKAAENLWETIGQDKIMVLATKNGDGVAARTVNVYAFDGNFYFVTEADSNKYAQISKNANVALSIDAIQITGHAILLEHPSSEANKQVISAVEKELPQQFARYTSIPIMRLIKVKPMYASFLSLKTGKGYIVNFKENTAVPIKHEM